jgi:hypothetical protein
MVAYGITPDRFSGFAKPILLLLMGICQTIAFFILTLTDAQITSKSDLENLVIITTGKG